MAVRAAPKDPVRSHQHIASTNVPCRVQTVTPVRSAASPSGFPASSLEPTLQAT